MFNFNIHLNVQFQHKIWMFNFHNARMLHQFLTTRASSNFILLLFSSFRAISMSLISWSFSSLFSIHICVQTRVKAFLKVKLQTNLAIVVLQVDRGVSAGTAVPTIQSVHLQVSWDASTCVSWNNWMDFHQKALTAPVDWSVEKGF